jgi:sodium/potassium-transporting ATPase subunit alpha
VDNSSLAGESEAQSRKAVRTHENPLETANIAFYSTNALEGKMTGIVIDTGDNTVIGRIANLVSGIIKLLSPIELEIRTLIDVLAIIAFITGLVFLGIGFILRYPWSSNITLFIGVVVGNVSENLMAMITVSLTLAAKRMVHKNALVKNLQVLETFGRTSTICSDKTGTLTENRMKVSRFWVNGLLCDATEFRLDPGDRWFCQLWNRMESRGLHSSRPLL